MDKPDPELPREHHLRLTTRVQESARALAAAVERGFNHWILTFSGGKDSTATLILVLETALEQQLPIQRIDVVYSDTLIEIPVIQQHAIHFLEFLARFERLRQLPMHLHIVRPALEERFWVCLFCRTGPTVAGILSPWRRVWPRSVAPIRHTPTSRLFSADRLLAGM